MKILKQPLSAQDWKMEHKCTSCEAILEVNASDFTEKRSAGFIPNFRCRCPCCNSLFSVSEDRLPFKVVQFLNERIKA